VIKLLKEQQVQVAIIAIFWNQRSTEKRFVLKKCEEVETLLKKQNIACHIDCNSKFTPGQRMRHWCVLLARVQHQILHRIESMLWM